MRIDLNQIAHGDIITKVERFNLIRNGRLMYLDVHETLAGRLAGNFVCVPNLINIVAAQEYQGVGDNVTEALNDCLAKIKGLDILDIFPQATPDAD